MKHRQIIMAGILSSAVTVAILVIVMHATNSSIDEKEVPNRHMTESNIESVGSKVDSEEIWRYKMKEKQKDVEDQLSKIQTDLVEAMKPREKAQSPEVDYSKLKSDVEFLKESFLSYKQESAAENITVDGENVSKSIRKIKLVLKDREVDLVKNIEDTIPAGAFAKAVLLSGVDASTAVSAQGDPKPLLIRLIDAGTLPRKFASDLKDCHIVASGYGDISSERVFARLEKLTCIERGTEEIIETEVAGYIAGEDGRAGIKGIVVEKGRGYLAKSVIGGILQGLSSVMVPYTSVDMTAVGTVIPPRTYSQKFQQGGMTGLSGSMDRLSKYYIDRAESISPIIQVASGRVMDVVFTEGTGIGTKRVKKILEEKRINQGTKDEHQ